MKRAAACCIDALILPTTNLPSARSSPPLRLWPSSRASSRTSAASSSAPSRSRAAISRGFAAPNGSLERRAAHHRAWIAVRELDRGLTAARLGRRASARLLARAQRAIDRADVMISALPGVLAT